MSSILYYSNYSEPCKKLLQTVTKTQNAKDIHFICIDKRVTDPNNGKTYIILQNEQKIIMPENVTKVPALLLLNQNYKVIYGDDIYQHLRPNTENLVKQATKNNMEPVHFQDGFSPFGGFGGGIVSDNFSFLDQSDNELSVKGNGGLRQMHSYVSLNDSMNLSMHLPTDDHEYKSDKLKDGEMSVESLQRKRDQELSNINYK
uniref:Uncharacterized protein n=1 Tax=viral metagenome TaxID=1070528 RepID=A0A6C0KLW2_9ZZZZ